MLEGSSEPGPAAASLRPGATLHTSRAIALVLCVSAIVVLTVGVVVVQYGDGGLSKTDVEDFIQSWGAAGAAVFVLLMVVHAFVPFPAELVAIANGMLFGVPGGTVLTWVGAMLGAALSFGLARRYGRPFAEAVVAAERWDRIQAWTQSRGVLALLGARSSACPRTPTRLMPGPVARLGLDGLAAARSTTKQRRMAAATRLSPDRPRRGLDPMRWTTPHG